MYIAHRYIIGTLSVQKHVSLRYTICTLPSCSLRSNNLSFAPKQRRRYTEYTIRRFHLYITTLVSSRFVGCSTLSTLFVGSICTSHPGFVVKQQNARTLRSLWIRFHMYITLSFQCKRPCARTLNTMLLGSICTSQLSFQVDS